jgi:IS5 family transposase
MSQLSFSEAEYDIKKRKTRREKFLAQMEQLIPWKKLERRLERYYPKKGKGRPPYPLSVMLRIHCMQLFYNLSDPAMEDALYEIESMRRFAGLKLTGPLPDETTILNFRHLLEKHELGKALFEEVNKHLSAKGLILKEGSIVDATIISAPSSTKNKDGKRDPEMHQTQKGNQWHFGMKMHIAVDDIYGIIHSITTTPANTHDLNEADKLLHGKEKRAWFDSGYRGIEKREEHKDRDIDWYVAMTPGKRKSLDKASVDEQLEKQKASIRAKVEHPFRYMKNVFGYNKVRYRGLAKNTQRLHLLSAFTNLLIGKRHILA